MNNTLEGGPWAPILLAGQLKGAVRSREYTVIKFNYIIVIRKLDQPRNEMYMYVKESCVSPSLLPVVSINRTQMCLLLKKERKQILNVDQNSCY